MAFVQNYKYNKKGSRINATALNIKNIRYYLRTNTQ